jgi:hypothetical protein
MNGSMMRYSISLLVKNAQTWQGHDCVVRPKETVLDDFRSFMARLRLPRYRINDPQANLVASYNPALGHPRPMHQAQHGCVALTKVCAGARWGVAVERRERCTASFRGTENGIPACPRRKNGPGGALFSRPTNG